MFWRSSLYQKFYGIFCGVRSLSVLCVINACMIYVYRVCQKNDPTCFCQNFVKSQPNLIIFGIQIAKTTEICKVHSLSTSHSSCQCTTV